MENEELRKKAIQNILSNVANEGHLKNNVFCSVGADVANISNIVFPKMPVHEISDAVKWEIKQMTKENFENTTYDYFVLDETKVSDLDKIQVLAITALKTDIYEHMSLFESVGLKVQAVEANPLSLLSNLEFNKSISDNEVVLVLDFGGGLTTLNIIKDKELQYTRTLNISGHSLTLAIKEYCHLMYDQAEDLKKKYGVAKFINGNNSDSKENQENEMSFKHPEQAVDLTGQIKNAVTLLFEKLVSDIDHTFKYYSYQLTKSRITSYDKIILSGGSANFPILVPLIYERLKVPVEVDNPLRRFEVDPNALLDRENLEKDYPRFGVALGLALRAVE